MYGRSIVVGTLVAIALVCSPGDAAADESPPFTIGSRPAWYLMAGVTSGGTVTADRGGYVGGEVSFVRLRDARFVGLYADGYYDFGIHRTYSTGGVELGYKVLGIDGGGAARFGSGRVEPGATGRLFFTAGILTIYARYAYFDSVRNDHVVQIGGSLKIPVLSPLGVP